MTILHIFMLMFPSAILEFSYIVYIYTNCWLLAFLSCLIYMPMLLCICSPLHSVLFFIPDEKVFCRNVGNNFCQSVKASVVSQAF